jgi:hypothetical protein
MDLLFMTPLLMREEGFFKFKDEHILKQSNIAVRAMILKLVEKGGFI